MIVSAEFCRGAGLGNKLFPWARAKIFARDTGCLKLQNRWYSPHGGGILRGGVDYAHVIRKILLLGNFKADPDCIGRIWGLSYRSFPVVKCASLAEARERCLCAKNVHIQFSWDKNHNFTEFANENGYLLSALEKITLESQLRFVKEQPEPEFIGINVRCGKDFVSAGSMKRGYVQTDLDWFCYALKKIRTKYGDLPAIVVSDGGKKQLEKLLSIRHVRLLNSPSAIADLLMLTGAKVLLGSGNSTFSAWASFLGQMDTYSASDTPFKFAGLENGRHGNKVLGTI